MAKSVKGSRPGLVPIPVPGTSDFPSDLIKKREFRLAPGVQGCDASIPFRIQPVQQFVSAYMSPLGPNKSILLFHGTGVGKTCAAVQAAELQGGGRRRTLVLVPASIQGGFEDNVYNVGKIKTGDVTSGSKFQCTGSEYYSRDLEKMTLANIKKTQRTKIRRSYDFVGHDKFANTVEAVERRAKQDFSALGPDAVDAEISAALRSMYDGRLIIVDEVHELRSENGTKPSYKRLLQVLRSCDSCRLILMSATPMYNRAVEITEIVNLMLVNDRHKTVSAKDMFGPDDVLTADGRNTLRKVLQGRVSAMNYEDPDSFPALIWPDQALPKSRSASAPVAPPSKTGDGKAIPEKNRLKADGEYKLYFSPLSKVQVDSYARYHEKAVTSAAANNKQGSLMTFRQFENVCYDAKDTAANEEAFFKAFKKVQGTGGRVFRYASESNRILSEKEIDKYAPKIGAATRLVSGADGLCFVYSSFRWSGVFPVAIALEELGFLPFQGKPLLHDAPGIGNAGAPRYVMITKDDESGDELSVKDKVDAANNPVNNIKAVLGTETASQGLDFKRIREVHLIEPWWNMSRAKQVIGRGIRRCSHVSLPEEQRNTTVYMHCTRDPRGGDRETLDQRVYRDALQKNDAIKDVESLLAESAVDCGMYELRSEDRKATHVSSQGKRISIVRKGSNAIRCSIKWPKASARSESSTVHPYIYKNMVDLLAFEIKEALQSRIAATFDELLAITRADELVLSLSLSTLMNPLLAWRWLGDGSLVYRGNLYVMVPEFMVDQPFTLTEARMGFLFSSNPTTRITPS